MTTFATLPLSAIVSSLTNPRKTFNQPKLQELADSIKAIGVHQPILVRPLPASRVPDTDRGVTHEIISGERRYRACTLAGLTTIPAMVRDMTDDQVLEAQLVENLQRDDLTELEEAEGYDTLRTATSLSVDEVAAKIGKSRSYVFARLKLLDLSHECKQAMRDGHVDASRALLIARIPDTALQTKALAEAMCKDYRGEVCSVRAFSSWLQANVMLKLENAVFVMADSQLVPAAGSCHVCPKRTGANPDLFADVQATDICTDPVCFHGKEEAHRADVLATAAKRGMRLVEGDEAQEICNRYSSNLIGYSPLAQQREDTADGQAASLGQLLGKDAPAAVLIENPWTKELIAAVPTDEAEAVLLARGLVKVVQAKQKTADDIEGDIKRLQARAKSETTMLFRKMAFTELATVVHGCDAQTAMRLVCPALVRAWWLRRVDELDTDNLARVFGLALMDVASNDPREILDAKETQIRLHIQACTQAKLYKAFALNLVMEDTPDYFYGELPEPTLINALAGEQIMDRIRAMEREAMGMAA